MRRATALVIGIVLGFLPLSLNAESSPTSGLLFDDVDPAAAQAELTQQIGSFLQTLQSHWGTNQDAIRHAIHADLERDDRNTLVYSRSLADHGVLEGYDFLDGALVQGEYLMLQRPVNGLNEFIDYYAAVKQALTSSYGAPADDRTLWENDLYQPLPDYWGVAVQLGHLRYAARWETAEGTISLELTGHHHSKLTVDYRSREFTGNHRAI